MGFNSVFKGLMNRDCKQVQNNNHNPLLFSIRELYNFKKIVVNGFPFREFSNIGRFICSALQKLMVIHHVKKFIPLLWNAIVCYG